VIEQGIDSIEHAEDWPQLLQLLNQSWRKSFYHWLRDRILERSLNAPTLVSVIQLFGTQFMNEADFAARPADTVRVVLDPLLAEANEESLSVIMANSTTFHSVVQAANSDSREMVSKRLSDISNAKEGDQREELEQLATALGIEIPVVETEIEETSSKEGEV
jgi:hypothetical protein